MVRPPTNIAGGSSVGFGRPVVPDVNSRFGRGTTSRDGVPGRAVASQPSQGSMCSAAGQRQPMSRGGSPGIELRASTARAAVSGPTNTIRAPDASSR